MEKKNLPIRAARDVKHVSLIVWSWPQMLGPPTWLVFPSKLLHPTRATKHAATSGTDLDPDSLDSLSSRWKNRGIRMNTVQCRAKALVFLLRSCHHLSLTLQFYNAQENQSTCRLPCDVREKLGKSRACLKNSRNENQVTELYETSLGFTLCWVIHPSGSHSNHSKEARHHMQINNAQQTELKCARDQAGEPKEDATQLKYLTHFG